MGKAIKLRFVTLLTVIRFPLVLIFLATAIVYTFCPRTWLFVLAFTSLVASAVTDLFDGYFARRFDVETEFGAHVDPLMDKFYYLSTLPLLVFVATTNGHMTHAVLLLVLTVLFLTRDQWVTFLRSIGSLYNVSGGAHWAGKLRTCITFPLICTVYYAEEAPWPLVSRGFIYFFEAVALATNMLSLYIYTRRYWPYLKQSASIEAATKEAS